MFDLFKTNQENSVLRFQDLVTAQYDKGFRNQLHNATRTYHGWLQNKMQALLAKIYSLNLSGLIHHGFIKVMRIPN